MPAYIALNYIASESILEEAYLPAKMLHIKPTWPESRTVVRPAQCIDGQSRLRHGWGGGLCSQNHRQALGLKLDEALGPVASPSSTARK